VPDRAKNRLQAIRLDSATFYSERAMRLAGFDGGVLKKARESGELRFTRIGREVLYSGRALLDWLELETQSRRQEE
jgi:hypothetical protein